MTFPNFIGIGAAKCGTTWMHNLLQQHPEIYMPTKRKEIDFFNMDSNYTKGLDWYESFFPDDFIADRYIAIGEFTPRYLNKLDAPQRIAQISSIQKLIVMLRNPVERAYSQYCHTIRNGYSKSFEDYLEERPYVIDHGKYAEKLEPFLEVFSPDQFCYFVFEESINNVEATQQKIAEFLDVSPTGFPRQIEITKTNKSYVPKYKWLNQIAHNVNQQLLDKNLDWIVHLSESLNIRKLLQQYNNVRQPIPPVSEKIRLSLNETFANDIDKLEKLLDINLDIWRRS